MLAGCASSYDCYTCGRVSCDYCPPNPLPSSNCPSSNCTDSIGQTWIATLPSVSYLETTPVTEATLDYYVPSPQQQLDANGNPVRGLDNQ